MALTKPRAYQIYDIDYKQATRVITVSNVTLSGGAPSQVDGVNLSLNDRVLVTGQSNAAQNGIYDVDTVGSGSNGTWIRSGDTNSTGELLAGTIVMVTEGLIYADTQWKLTTDNPITIGVSELIFEQNSAFAFGNVNANGTAVLANSVGSTLNLTAGDNISISGNNTSKTVTIGVTGISLNSISNGTSNVNVVSSGGNVTVGIAGTSNVAVFSSTGANVTGTLGVSGNITGGNVTTAGQVSATGNITGGNLKTSGVTISSTGVSATTVTASGNVSGGNLTTAGQVSATGSISSDGNVIAGTNTKAAPAIFYTNSANSQYGALLMQKAGTERWLIGSDNTTGNGNVVIRFNATTNYVTVTETGLVTIAGNVSGGNLLTTGLISATGNVTGGNLRTASVTIGNGPISGVTTISASGNANVGNIGATTGVFTNISGTLTTASQTNITAVGTLGSLAVTGNITSGNLSGTRGVFTNLVGTLETASQPNITSVGTLGSLSVTGNVTGGNLTTTGQVVATGNITGGNLSIVNNVTISGNLSVTGNATLSGNILGDRVQNGTTSIDIQTPNGNANISIGGTSNVAVFSTTGANVTGTLGVTGNITGGNILGNGAGLTGINAFSNVTVTGGNSAVADSIADTLTFTAGTGIAIVVDSVTDTITIAASGGSEIFVDGADFGTVTEAVTLSDDLGLVTEAVESESDLGTIVTSGLIYPDQFVLPSFTTTTLPSASVAGAMIYVTNESGGAVPAFSDGTNWRRVTDRAIVS